MFSMPTSWSLFQAGTCSEKAREFLLYNVPKYRHLLMYVNTVKSHDTAMLSIVFESLNVSCINVLVECFVVIPYGWVV
jgi:hypothetical protein